MLYIRIHLIYKKGGFEESLIPPIVYGRFSQKTPLDMEETMAAKKPTAKKTTAKAKPAAKKTAAKKPAAKKTAAKKKK